jgi:hypothetical protein
MMIASDESSIVGTWKMIGGKIEADETCLRIDRLIHEHLKESGRDASGWDVLYVDPTDGRYWELTYPQGEMHGGGPPALAVLSAREAQEKYVSPIGL